MRVIFASSLALILMSPSVAIADDCSASLVVTHEAHNLTVADKLAIYQTVTQSEFDTAKQSASNGATALIGDIPVTSNTTWDDFKQKMSTYQSEYKYNLEINEAEAYVHSYLPSTSLQAYSLCLQSTHPVGTHLWVDPHEGSQSDRIVTVRVVFNTAESGGTAKRMYFNYFGGSLSIPKDQWTHFNKFTGSLEEVIFFQRDALDIGAGISARVPSASQGQTAVLYFPRRPTISRLVEVPQTVRSQDHYATGGASPVTGNYCFPHNEHDSAWLNDGYKVVSAESFAEPTDGRATQGINPPSVTPTSACAAFVVNADADQTGHGANVGVTVHLQKERWVSLPVEE